MNYIKQCTPIVHQIFNFFTLFFIFLSTRARVIYKKRALQVYYIIRTTTRTTTKRSFYEKIFVFLENIRIFFNFAPLLAALAGDAYMMALLLYTAFAFLP